jgi:DNA-binding MarR family transcriptional regulator
MTIEEAIQQKRPFKTARERAMVNLIYTHNWIKHRVQQFFKPFGITMKQYNVLRILKGADGPISTAAIRERLLDKMSDASRMVDRLHQKGLVLRHVCPNDKRLVDVYLSKKGEELLDSMEALRPKMDNVLGEISEEEATLLNNILDKLRTK